MPKQVIMYNLADGMTKEGVPEICGAKKGPSL
jgi:hypothetical protein